jgi:hypothetical protein
MKLILPYTPVALEIKVRWLERWSVTQVGCSVRSACMHASHHPHPSTCMHASHHPRVQPSPQVDALHTGDPQDDASRVNALPAPVPAGAPEGHVGSHLAWLSGLSRIPAKLDLSLSHFTVVHQVCE